MNDGVIALIIGGAGLLGFASIIFRKPSPPAIPSGPRTDIKPRAFAIYLERGTTKSDMIVTKSEQYIADDWRAKLKSVGFTDVSIYAFKFEGNVSFSDVDQTLYRLIDQRPKLGIVELGEDSKPVKKNTKVVHRDNLHHIEHRWHSTNEYQKLIANELSSAENRIHLGWFSGDLSEWLTTTSKLSSKVSELLDQTYPFILDNGIADYMYSRDIRPDDFVPDERTIHLMNLKMVTLYEILTNQNVLKIDYPTNRILKAIEQVLVLAREIPAYKQWTVDDVKGMWDIAARQQLDRDVQTWNLMKKVLVGATSDPQYSVTAFDSRGKVSVVKIARGRSEAREIQEQLYREGYRKVTISH